MLIIDKLMDDISTDIDVETQITKLNPKVSITDISKSTGMSRPGVYKKIKEKKIPAKIFGNTIYLTHELSKLFFNYKFKNKIITIQIVKGGTGKTTITLNLAIKSSLYGARVLCIDLDKQANLTRSFNVIGRSFPTMLNIIKREIDAKKAILNVCEGIDLIPAKIDIAGLDNLFMLNILPVDQVYKKILAPIRNEYDLILFDCPPTLGQSVSSASCASDYIIAPIAPEKYSTDGLKIMLNEYHHLSENYNIKIKVKLLLNKYDSRTKLSRDTLNELFENKIYKNGLFKGFISMNQIFPNSIKECTTIFDNLRPNSSKIDIDILTREVLDLDNE